MHPIHQQVAECCHDADGSLCLDHSETSFAQHLFSLHCTKHT